MSFISMPLGEAKEKELLPEGTYVLRIVKADMAADNSDPNAVNTVITLIAEDYPDARPIFHRIWGVRANDDDQKRNNKLLQAIALLKAFKIPYSAEGYDVQEFAGCTGKVKVGLDEYEGNVKNVLVLPW